MAARRMKALEDGRSREAPAEGLTFYERGFQEGELRGMRQGWQLIAECAFGLWRKETAPWLEAMTAKQLDRLVVAITKVHALRQRWVQASTRHRLPKDERGEAPALSRRS